MAQQIDPDINVAMILAFAERQKRDLERQAKKEEDPDNASYISGQEASLDLVIGYIIR